MNAFRCPPINSASSRFPERASVFLPAPAFLRSRYKFCLSVNHRGIVIRRPVLLLLCTNLVKIIVFLAGRNQTDANCHYTTFFRLISANYRSDASLMRPPSVFCARLANRFFPKFWPVSREGGIRRERSLR